MKLIRDLNRLFAWYHFLAQLICGNSRQMENTNLVFKDGELNIVNFEKKCLKNSFENQQFSPERNPRVQKDFRKFDIPYSA